MQKLSKYKWYILAVAAILFGIFIPRIYSNAYMLTVMCNALISTIAVYGLSIILGMGGQVTFSTAGMMGIGAFVTGIGTVRFGLHPILCLVLSIVIVGIFSLIIGLLLFRLRGTYFAFATIALVQVLFVVMLNWKEATGGAEGLPGIPPLDLGFMTASSPLDYFYIIFGFSIICGLIVHRVRTSSLGRSLASVRDNEIAANSLGVNVFRTKVVGFVIAGIFAAIAGSLYAHVNTYLSAEAFTFDHSGIFLIMVMLGGVASTVGAFVGTVLLTILPEAMRFMQTYYKLVYGIGVIIVMVFMPMGIAGMVKDLLMRITRRKTPAVDDTEQDKEEKYETSA
ncbi:MAG: branched-chain amino acid ABC transporter permease [Christensenellales bacterium]